MSLRIGPLTVIFHRTVRVAEGRQPANLPPSLGHIKLYEVSTFKDRCPSTWEPEGVFMGLHPNEAMWMSFGTASPVALLVGAGSVNALTGQRLGTKLEADNYLVTPPQPWLDGWKGDTGGTVYQFCATAYKKGDGLTVAEQIIGAESRTGGIGIALFEPKEPLPVKHHTPSQGWGPDAYDSIPVASAGGSTTMSFTASATGQSVNSVQRARAVGFTEYGLGKGGLIKQHIYPDPYGLDVWRELPSQSRAIYLVEAALLAEITGEPIPAPVTQKSFTGPWFAVQDTHLGDVPGAAVFTGLKSVFAEESDPVPKKA
jgi:hypothetical protein